MTVDASWLTIELFVGITMNVIGLSLLAAVIIAGRALKQEEEEDCE